LNSNYRFEQMRQKGVILGILTCVLILLCAPFFVQDSGAWSRGHFYVIGVGPAGPRNATLQALDTIRKMDCIIATSIHQRFFRQYIGDKPVLDFDPWEGFWDYKGKDYWKLAGNELKAFRVERFRIRDERVKKIKSLISRGKDVGLLDSGNPCLFGPSYWYIDQFDPADVVVIPGMGCEAAALAALKKSIIPAYNSKFVIQTAPFFLLGSKLKNRKALKDLAKYSGNMVFYMALWQSRKLFDALKEVFPPDMPCAVVYWAGYPDLQRVLTGTVDNMADKLSHEKERFMGLLFVGRFLKGKSFEAAMKEQ